MLAVSNITYSRNGAKVIDDLSLAAEPGSLLQVRGSNGSGKTTLLRLVSGLLEPDGGRVAWDGVPIGSPESRHRGDFAYVGHRYGLKSELTARENLAFHAGVSGGGGMFPDEALCKVGLADKASSRCADLSAGQLRRVALARLLLGRARLWLLDEPLANLDDEGVDTLRSMLADHLKGGLAIVTTHRGTDWGGLAVQEISLG